MMSNLNRKWGLSLANGNLHRNTLTFPNEELPNRNIFSKLRLLKKQNSVKLQKSQNNLEYGQNNNKINVPDFLVTNEQQQQQLSGFDYGSDTNFYKIIGLSTNSTESFNKMKQQQVQQPSFKEMIPNFDDQFHLHVQQFNPYKTKHTLSIDLNSKIVSKLQGDNLTDVSDESSDLPTQPETTATTDRHTHNIHNHHKPHRQISKISIKLNHFKFDIIPKPNMNNNCILFSNAFKCTNHANFFANKTLLNPNSGSSQTSSNNQNITNATATITKLNNQINRSTLNRSPNNNNLTHIMMSKSVSLAETFNNNIYNNSGNLAISADTLDHRHLTDAPTTTATALAASLLSGQPLFSATPDTLNSNLMKISRQVPVHKKRDMSATNDRILLSTIEPDSELESKNLNSTIANESATDQWKFYKENSFMTKNVTHFPDTNWNRMQGSKVRTTTIKANLSNQSTNSIFLKKRQLKQAMSKSATISKHPDTLTTSSLKMNASREVSVIDLKLPVKQSQTLQTKRKSILNDSTNPTVSLENPTNTLTSEEPSLASRIIGSIGYKQTQATTQIFPSPITTVENKPNDSSDTNGITDVTKSYFQRANQRQFQNHFNNEQHNLNKRSINFFNQDTGVPKVPASSMGNISHNSLLVRRLKLL